MGIRRVLLIQPPLHENVMTIGFLEPLGLEVIAAGITDEERFSHIEVRILDLRVARNLSQTLQEFNPDIVGVSGITIDFPGVLQALKIVKEFSGKIVTVVGGHHASVAPKDFFLSNVDFIVKGPGVIAFQKLVEAFDGSHSFDEIAGIFYRKDEQYTETQSASFFEMSQVPTPNRRLTEKYRTKYRIAGKRSALMTSSLGCPSRCSFCACWKILNGSYTVRSPAEVVAEIQSIKEKHIFIGDDHTFGNIRRVENIYELLKESKVEKSFEAYSRADTIVANPDVFRKWASVGLVGLTVGVEAITDEELVKYNKGGTIAANQQANQILLECGIENYAHLIVKPDYTEDDFAAVIRYTLNLGVAHPIFLVLTPLPGTDVNAESTEIFPNKHEYYDLCHPLFPTKLSVGNFYREFTGLYNSNYSFKRWLIYNVKRVARMIFFPQKASKSVMGDCPDIKSIVVMRLLIATLFTRRRLGPFLTDLSTRRGQVE